jgi:hypothetical protein
MLADAEVAAKLYERACGDHGSVIKVPYTVELPPDTTAAQLVAAQPAAKALARQARGQRGRRGRSLIRAYQGTTTEVLRRWGDQRRQVHG